MEILLAPYELVKHVQGVQRGTLVKVSENGFWGVADLCTHPELGDRAWEDEVRSGGPLYKRALQLAQDDLAARKNGVSLLTAKKIPNNILITDFLAKDLNDTGLTGKTVKIKGDHRTEQLAAAINNIAVELTLRIDFNAKLSAPDFEKFLSKLSHKSLQKIEYIEDPAPISEKWKVWNTKVPLASDWQKTEDPLMASYRIIKPAREEIPAGRASCTFTSAMDHPVGVAHGLRLAQQYAKNVSGFLTLDIFKSTPYHKYFETEGEWLGFSGEALNDTGIGMTDELEKLRWTPAKEVLP